MLLEKRPNCVPHGFGHCGEFSGIHQHLEHFNLLPGQSDRYSIHHLDHQN